MSIAVIEDPWHSRPLDVHRWSDHPEVKVLVDKIWDESLPKEIVGGPGPKPKTAFRKQLRVLILDLYVAWLEDPDLSIGVHMSPNEWNAGSRYNALHLSKKMIPIIKALHDSDLIDLAKGSYGGSGVTGNRITRIRAAPDLQDQFAKAKFSRDDIGRVKGEELIILKDDKNNQVEYQDTPETNRMRDELRAYNELIAESFIDIPLQEEPVVELGQKADNRVVRLANNRTHRVFSRSSWERHGRFYGGWWQQLNSDWRAKITIDMEPTIEVDYQGLHVAMLFAEDGQNLTHDPYDIAEFKIGGYPSTVIRKLAKRLVLTAINAKDRSSAYGAFRDGIPAGRAGNNLKNERLNGMLEAILKRNPCLRDRLFTDQGIRLMNKDGQITSFIHNHFTKKGVPVLSVHDSYIVDCRLVTELKKTMAEASEEVVGRALPASPNIPGKEEFAPVSDHELQWYIYSKEKSGCPGYMERAWAYEKRTGRSIVPE